MEVIIFSDRGTASLYASKLVTKCLKRKPNSVLGLATGSTPLELYNNLVTFYQNKELSFHEVKSFNLDEYVGIAPEQPQSYHAFMKLNLFSKVDILPSNTHIPDGLSKNIEADCEDYERQIDEAGGIDLQILGLGQDGHLGFNEPSSSLNSKTRIKTLTEETRKANAVHFGSIDKVPKHVITMGLATIMKARQCVLLAFGSSKADAVAKMVEGPVSAMCPASILQMHPRTTVILDEPAAKQLVKTAYYKEVFANKPKWQQV